MYTYLQGSNILGNTNVIPNGWDKKIDSVYWNIGDVGNHSNLIISEIIESEFSLQTINDSKIGLMYLSDYYYAYTVGGGTQNCFNSTCTNWMTDSSSTYVYVWTMTRYGDYGDGYGAWAIKANGGVIYPMLTKNTHKVTPSFYLDKDVYITNPEATGLSTDPFILSY